jgi:very-short-patch-repair endonuclease
MEIKKMNKILTHIDGNPIYRNNMGVLPADNSLKSRAKSLRKAGVLSEVAFWLEVKSGKFHTIDFDRQRIIGNYIVDFYVKALGLVIEIDGTSHNDKEEYDKGRENYLMNLGLKIYRISDLRVKHDLRNVLQELEVFIIRVYSR